MKKYKALINEQYEIKGLENNFEGAGKAGNFEVNWSDLMKLKRERIAGMAPFLDGKFKEYDLDVAHGKGIIIDEHKVHVGAKKFTKEKIVIWNGLRTFIQDIQ